MTDLDSAYVDDPSLTLSDWVLAISVAFACILALPVLGVWFLVAMIRGITSGKKL